MQKLIFLTVILGLLASACQVSPSEPQATQEPNEKPASQVNELAGKVNYDPNPNATAQEVYELAQSQNAFALDIYQGFTQNNDNLVFSPYSIFQALVMTYSGARGTTEEQMAQVLRLPWKNELVHPVMNALNLALLPPTNLNTEEGQAFKLNIANSLWGQTDYHFEQEFLDTLSANYAAGLKVVDFNDPEAARELINLWVEAQTNEKIKNLIPQGILDPMTRLVLTNAVYFNASWRKPFLESATKPADFFPLEGEPYQVETMHDDIDAIGYQDEAYQIVELPYVDGQYVMDLIMPLEDSIEQFEADLTPETLNHMLLTLEPGMMRMALPKFKIEGDSISLVPVLKKLGMLDAFELTADFSGMTGNMDLMIDDVLHQAFIDVNEAGTEAAAATAVVMQEKAMPEVVEMKFEHPFIFLIRDIQTGTILFMGRVTQP